MELIVFEVLFTVVVMVLLAVLYKTEQTNSLAMRRLAAIEAAGDGIGIMDEYGNLTYMNRALMELHEIKDSSLYIGRSWANLYTEKGREQINNHVMPYLERHGSWRGESPIVTATGQIVFAEMYLTRLPNGGFIGTARDITKRKLVEEEKEVLQKKYIQAQKMEMIGSLTGGIAHDFNNMLTVISGNLEILDEDIDPKAPAKTNIMAARRAVSRGAELTQRLLAFSRQQILAPQTINLNNVVPDTIEMMKRTLGAQIEITYLPRENLWNTMIDIGQVENALLNLCINARDAMPKGGKITISTENVSIREGDERPHSYIEPGEYVMISIADTGEGIPEELLGKVFDPFFTTKEVGQGSGLGLSMVYGFTKQSGGYVSIDSEVGKGTTICLYFPKGTHQNTVPVYVEGVDNSEIMKGEGNILFVEDEADVLDFTTHLLRKIGYTVKIARSGAEAVMMLDKIEALDILVTDVIMPGGVGGKELAEEVRSCFPDVRILYVSGYAPEDLQSEMLDKNTDFLAKPYRKEALASKIRTLLQQG